MKHVARVEVAVEDAGHAGAVQQRIVHLAEDRRRLAIREVVRLQLAERPPGHRAHDDHSLGDAVEHRFGDLPATGGGGAQRTVHLEEIRHLDPEVKFLGDRLGETAPQVQADWPAP